MEVKRSVKFSRLALLFSALASGIAALTQCEGSGIATRMARLENRIARVENRLCNILSTRFPEACSNHTVTLTDLVASLADVTQTLESLNVTSGASQSEESQPIVCERGMASSVSEPFLILNNTLLNRKIRCDTQTDGGGWIVFQRRVNGNIGFYRNWATYRNGFGDLLGNFWLGNQALYRLTNANNYELRMDVKFNGQNFYAKFSSFRVENESQKFRLRLGTYSGTVGDTAGFGMNYSNNRAFSTHDRDNDGTDRLSCAVNGKSAWWYDRCTKVDLNGEYDKKTPPKGIRWNNGVANRYATFTEMKIRRV